MNPHELLTDLAARGVVLQASGGRLLFDAPAGVLTDADHHRLREYKPDLLELLTVEARQREYSEPPPTGKDTPCVTCGSYCGTDANCAFCARKF